MGTYPGMWSKGWAYPAWKHLKPVPCPGPPRNRTCGIEGQVLDMLAAGARPDQIQPGIETDRCAANGR